MRRLTVRWRAPRALGTGGLATPAPSGVAAALLALGLTVAAVVPSSAQEPFPHETHAGLFPVCTGCHAGAESGSPETLYPEPAQCVRCHDGVAEERVAWEGPSDRPTNVRFVHVDHAASLTEAGDAPVTCEQCHSASDAVRMSVEGAERLDTCFSCHAHPAQDHFDPAVGCESCHVPVSESGFEAARLASLPTPPSHDDPLYLPERHGLLAPGAADRCATCHTRERCASCHVDGGLVAITAIPGAPAGMELPPMEARYPAPVSHLDDGWMEAHKLQAPVRECSTCHTQDDCRSCHVGRVPTFIERLPSRARSAAPGVGLVPSAPSSHESLFFARAHPTLAAADGQSCATCHTEAYCVRCHDGPPDGGYHPPSFVARHAADAFARTEECATCHSTEAFCRACHVETGLGSRGRLGAGYHDAEAVWLLRHGQAARQSLESCASCHRQNDCVQCHGVLGSFSVSPHSRDFDSAAAWRRSPRTCLACHVRNPIGGAP